MLRTFLKLSETFQGRVTMAVVAGGLAYASFEFQKAIDANKLEICENSLDRELARVGVEGVQRIEFEGKPISTHEFGVALGMLPFVPENNPYGCFVQFDENGDASVIVKNVEPN